MYCIWLAYLVLYLPTVLFSNCVVAVLTVFTVLIALAGWLAHLLAYFLPLAGLTARFLAWWPPYICMYVWMLVCMYVHMYVRTYVCMYAAGEYGCMYVCKHLCVFVCVWCGVVSGGPRWELVKRNICIYLCMHVCMYISMSAHQDSPSMQLLIKRYSSSTHRVRGEGRGGEGREGEGRRGEGRGWEGNNSNIRRKRKWVKTNTNRDSTSVLPCFLICLPKT